MSSVALDTGLMVERVLGYARQLGLDQFSDNPVKLARGLEVSGLTSAPLATLHQLFVKLEQPADQTPFVSSTAFQELDVALQGLLKEQGAWLASEDPYSRLEGLDLEAWEFMGTRLAALGGVASSGVVEAVAQGAEEVYKPTWPPVNPDLVEEALRGMHLALKPARILYPEAYHWIDREDLQIGEGWLALLEAQRNSFPHHDYQPLHVERQSGNVTKLAKVRLRENGRDYYWYPAKLEKRANPAARKAMICSVYDEICGTTIFPKSFLAVLGGELGVLREIAPGKEPTGLDAPELTERWPILVAVQFELGNVDVITPNLVLDETADQLWMIDPDYTLAPGLVQYTTAKITGTHLPNRYPEDFVARRLATSEEAAAAEIRRRIGPWMTKEELDYLLLRRAIVRADLERRIRP